MNGLSFIVLGKPEHKGDMSSRIITSKKTGKQVSVVYHKNNKTLMAWQNSIATVAKSQMNGHPPLDCPIFLIMDFRLPRPKSTTRDYPAVKPDLDKLQRAVLDALEGICYVNDSRIVTIQASKSYADQVSLAGVSVMLVPVTNGESITSVLGKWVYDL